MFDPFGCGFLFSGERRGSAATLRGPPSAFMQITAPPARTRMLRFCRRCPRRIGSDRALVVRVGLIGGPGDIFDRSGYWPWRFARPAAADGSVLVPDVPALATQVIDVRDLAAWIVESGSGGLRGTFNATGEAVLLPLHLEAARKVADHSGPVIAASQEWLLAQGVEPWMGSRSLPLWLPMPEYAGFSSRDSSAARDAGLVTRSLEETLTDTLAWEMTRDPRRPRRAGLSDDDERRLLHALVRS
jgi:2'-hydroxyisoflavone reductase